MNLDALYSELTLKTKAKLALVVLDGLGDIATKEQNYLTPLEAAATPNLDKLCTDSAQGRMIPAAPGITPGSGPGHLGLFGYDPLEFQVGRGVIEALGLGVELQHGDVCARANFATLDPKGIVTYRRAGGNEELADLRSLCRLCHDAVTMIEYGEGMGMDRINPEDPHWRDPIIEKRREIVAFRSRETRRRMLEPAARLEEEEE